ncbi:MAG: hypothetical protein ACREE5_15115 [Acetobacteraceae bacterium]
MRSPLHNTTLDERCDHNASRRRGRRRPIVTAVAAIATAATLAGCVVVPARPVYYRPVPVRPYAYVLY